MSRCVRALALALVVPAASAQVAFVDGTSAPGHAPEAATAPLAFEPVAHPSSLLWPLAPPLGTDSFLSNYVDDDPAQGSMIDYMGGRDHLYDGHRGTDVAIHNFQLQDRGIPVVAAAPGTVQSTTYHFGDRNTSTPYPDGGNGLSILHDDGSRAFYWHVRTNSVVVEPGERVEAGQPLAYVGSSGWTPIPHLHFELSGGRDPWEGTFHTAPSLWAEQPAYVGDAPIWMMDADVFTLDAVGGSLSGLTQRKLKERIHAPAVIGTDEPAIYAWTHLQANVGDQYLIRLLDATGTQVGAESVTIGQKTRYGWYAHVFAMPANAPEGTWRLVVTSGARTLREVDVEVGAATAYGPRVQLPSSAPEQMVGGHSFRLDGTAQALALGVAPFTGPVTYALSDAPAYASLDGATLRLAADADQPFRSRLFHVVATDAAGRTDTLWVQAVHPGRPFNSPPTSADAPSEAERLRLRLAPNPSRGAAVVSLAMGAPGPVRVAVLDALGREVAVPTSGERAAGTHTIPLHVGRLGAGVYTVRAETPGGAATVRWVVVR